MAVAEDIISTNLIIPAFWNSLLMKYFGDSLFLLKLL